MIRMGCTQSVNRSAAGSWARRSGGRCSETVRDGGVGRHLSPRRVGSAPLQQYERNEWAFLEMMFQDKLAD